MIRNIITFSGLIAVFLSQNAIAFDFGFKSETSQKRSYIYAVGSSTVSPFMSAVAEEFSRSQNLKNIATETPVVESSGTKEGFRFFCEGIGQKYPDFANASRPIEKNEMEECFKNGVEDVVEIKIGYDGIVLGNSVAGKKIKLTKDQIFLALAEKTFDQKSKKLVKNPYQKWSDIDASLPQKEILIYGPPLTSGTRDVFGELLLDEVCMAKKEFVIAYKNKDERSIHCHSIRKDGKFVESGENDNLLIQNLKNNPDAFGIVGFNFLVANRQIIQAVAIDGIEPNQKTISSKKYPLSRPLFVYFKKQNLGDVPHIKDFIKEVVSLETIGHNGYLVRGGLISLTDSELKKVREEALLQLQ